MRPIDEKIVAMKMDNSDFKKKAVETTSIFGKLQESLNKIPGINLGRTVKDLGDIHSTTSRMDLSVMSSALDNISNKFSALNVMATTALVNITNRAVNAGLALQRSLTIDQMVDGFREYEMKMGSINTMLANTEWAGTTLDDVKHTLGELNEYADQTIYSFAQMTQNIGRFTASGVTLGDSTIAIKGLGNLAAISGSTSDQLNTAMYQMSQALASGRLTLMDWNSMVNAGMGGKKTQDALVATAKAMGIAVDMSSGFRDSIQDGWLTSEVLLETLKQFGSDKSMTEAATKVRTFTQMLATLREGIGSGWAETWEIVFGDFEEATKLWTNVSESLKKPFDEFAEDRNRFLRAFIDAGGMHNLVEGLKNAFKPLSQLFNIMTDRFKKVFPKKSIADIIRLTQAFREFTEGLAFSGETTIKLMNVFESIFTMFSTLWQIIKSLTKAVSGLLPSFKNLAIGALSILSSIGDMIVSFIEFIKNGKILSYVMVTLSTILSIINVTIYGLGDLLGWVGDRLASIPGLIGKAFGGTEIQGVNADLNSMKDTLGPITRFFKGLFDSLVIGFGWIRDRLVDFGQAITDSIPSGDQIIAGGFVTVLVATVGAIIATGWKLFETFMGWASLGNSLSESLESVGNAINAFSAGIYAFALIQVAVAMFILAVALKKIEDLDTKDIAEGLYALIGALSGLIGGIAIISKYNLVAQMGTIGTIIALSIAVAILATSFKILKDLGYNDITKGITALVAMMGALAGAVILMSRFNGPAVAASSLQLIAIAASIRLLVYSIDELAKMDTAKLYKGMTALGYILLQLGLFLKGTNGVRFGLGAIVGIVAISGAIHVMVSAIKRIAKIDTKQLAVGLTTITVILGTIALFVRATSNTKMFASSIGLVAIAMALNALVIPIKVLGSVPLTVLAKGLGAISLMLLSIATASLLMKGTVASAIGIAILAGALTLLVKPITTFAEMSWESMIKGFVGITGALALISGVAFLLAPATAPLLAFGISIGILGLAMLAAGAGMSLFGTGLLALSTISAGIVGNIINTIGKLIEGFISLIPAAVDFISKTFTSIMDTMVQFIPKVVDMFLGFITKMIQTLADRMPEFLKSGTDLVVNFIDGISESFPRVTSSATNLVITYIEAMANAVEVEGPRMVNAMMRLWGSVLLVMVEAGSQMINAIFGWIPGVQEATSTIGATAEKYIRDNFMAGSIADDKGKDFTDGLNGMQGAVGTAGENLALAGNDGLSSIKTNGIGINFGQGFIDGMVSKSGSIWQSAANLAKSAWNAITDTLLIRSPSRVMIRDGGWFGEGFAIGISNSNKTVGDSAKRLATTARDSLNQFLGGFDPSADNEIRYRVVVDDSEFDPDKFDPKTRYVKPDTRYTNGLATSTKEQLRQNNNTAPRERDTDKDMKTFAQEFAKQMVDNGSLVNIQPAPVNMDGREVAKVIFEYTSKLIDEKTTRLNRAEGRWV